MKKILFLVTIITLNLQLETLNCHAQSVTIPDTAFVNWLTANGFGSCMSGNLMDTTCPAILNAKILNCTGEENISNLYGIQYFKSLDTLRCGENIISVINQLPGSLQYLNCYYNNLDSLPALPATLGTLQCSSNNLSNLPALPPNLTYLDCGQNNIDSLPPLPAALTALYAYTNNFISLPALPAGLQYLDCSNSSLTSLPALPDSLYELDITSDPISCLPQINKITYFYFQNTSVACVIDYGQVNNSVPVITSLPLCSASNPNSCSPAGVDEFQVPGFRFQVFPNPASGSFTISTSTELKNAVVEIYNLVGEKVSSIKMQDTRPAISPAGGGRGVEVNTTLPAGIYFVRVSNGQQQFNQKLIVQ